MAQWGRWDSQFLDGKRSIGDPAADEPVAEVLASGEDGLDRVNELLATLVRVGDPVPAALPDELVDYLETTIELPSWAEPKKIERGQDVFARHGVPISVCLFCASLPSAYAAAKGVVVLERTSRLATDARRA